MNTTTKTIVAIGGGEIKTKTTLEIDGYVARLAKKRAGDARANGLFIGTASHDSMPYFNSFRKIYTSLFDVKADVALTVYGEMDLNHIKEKFARADMIYIGGGDTKFMLDSWRLSGLLALVCDAYERGVVIAGLSAGAICWFERMYTDYDIIRGESNKYRFLDGLGLLMGVACPHFDERREDFYAAMSAENIKCAFGFENNAAAVFENGTLSRTLSSGGGIFEIKNDSGKISENKLEPDKGKNL